MTKTKNILLILLASAALSAPTFAQESNPCAANPCAANPCSANPCAGADNPCANPCAVTTSENLNTAGPILPEGTALWDPAEQEWSKKAMVAMIKIIHEQPIPSTFLGSVDGMEEYKRANWAWFADGFNPEDYATMALAPATNSLGRYHVTGQELIRTQLYNRLRTQGPKAWRKSLSLSDEADLVLYMNIRAFKSTGLDVQVVAELLGVDKDGKVVLKLQVESGKSGAASAGFAMATGSYSAIPDDHDQFEYLTGTMMEAGNRFFNAINGARKAVEKGEPDFPSSPAVDLHMGRVELVDQQREGFGPAMQAQIASYLDIIRDPEADLKDRRSRARDLGKMGATAIVTDLRDFALDKKASKKVNDDIAWAMGETGHPQALDLIKQMKGVKGRTKKYAKIKLTSY